jgi:hypothetical protein
MGKLQLKHDIHVGSTNFIHTKKSIDNLQG